jgi:hypothetical protein
MSRGWVVSPAWQYQAANPEAWRGLAHSGSEVAMAVPPSKGPVGSEKAAAQLVVLEQKLEAMRRKFQQYFNGFERLPPIAEFETLKRDFRELGTQQYSTGQARFKAQNLLARWQLQRTLWERDLGRMEEGKFKTGAGKAAMGGNKDLESKD